MVSAARILFHFEDICIEVELHDPGEKVLSALRLFCQGIFMFWTVELQYPGEQNCPLLYGFLDYYYLQFRKSTRSWGKRET